ncbi:hypothetical protein HELRODRAFT_172389 [Helobdella robusta]|uniref:Uncharacterized protein n=1 Tax=Helobdella robusta TaxID=6412 RepID=T1F587_HELRO|nr:hypothetical protein HELRODRAFT_172389 [Helobdella robusta]ESO04714.1 hypothetical protein HELRODRAFT_172389 [Helobdella robusta]
MADQDLKRKVSSTAAKSKSSESEFSIRNGVSKSTFDDDKKIESIMEEKTTNNEDGKNFKDTSLLSIDDVLEEVDELIDEFDDDTDNDNEEMRPPVTPFADADAQEQEQEQPPPTSVAEDQIYRKNIENIPKASFKNIKLSESSQRFFKISTISSLSSIDNASLRRTKKKSMKLEQVSHLLEKESVAFLDDFDIPDIPIETDEEEDEEENDEKLVTKSSEASTISPNAEVVGRQQETSDFTLLDPDHPQMDRFQEALREQYEKKNGELIIEMMEANNCLKKKKEEKTEMALYLRYLQADVEKSKSILQKQQTDFEEVSQKRKKEDDELEEARRMYEEKLMQLQCENKKLENLKVELDNVNTHHLYLECKGSALREDIMITRRCLSRTKQLANQAEEKQQEHVRMMKRNGVMGCGVWVYVEECWVEGCRQRNDLLLTQLNRKKQRIEEDIDAFNLNIDAMQLEIKLLNESISEAAVELEAVQLEKKNVMQQWDCQLLIAQKKDESHNQALQVYQSILGQLKSETSAIEQLNKAVSEEQLKNADLLMEMKKSLLGFFLFIYSMI